MKYIRIDGGGENKGIEDLVEEMGGITIENSERKAHVTNTIASVRDSTSHW